MPTRAQAVAGAHTDTHLGGVASVVGAHTGATKRTVVALRKACQVSQTLGLF